MCSVFGVIISDASPVVNGHKHQRNHVRVVKRYSPVASLFSNLLPKLRLQKRSCDYFSNNRISLTRCRLKLLLVTNETYAIQDKTLDVAAPPVSLCRNCVAAQPNHDGILTDVVGQHSTLRGARITTRYAKDHQKADDVDVVSVHERPNMR